MWNERRSSASVSTGDTSAMTQSAGARVEGRLLEAGDLEVAAAADAHGAHVEADAHRDEGEHARVEREGHTEIVAVRDAFATWRCRSGAAARRTT